MSGVPGVVRRVGMVYRVGSVGRVARVSCVGCIGIAGMVDIIGRGGCVGSATAVEIGVLCLLLVLWLVTSERTIVLVAWSLFVACVLPVLMAVGQRTRTEHTDRPMLHRNTTRATQITHVSWVIRVLRARARPGLHISPTVRG